MWMIGFLYIADPEKSRALAHMDIGDLRSKELGICNLSISPGQDHLPRCKHFKRMSIRITYLWHLESLIATPTEQ